MGSICEKRRIIQEDGYRIQLDEITGDQVDLKWGTYTNPQEKVLTFHPDRPAIVSHFRISDGGAAANTNRQNIAERRNIPELQNISKQQKISKQQNIRERQNVPKQQSIPERQFVVYRQSTSYDLQVEPTKDKARSFFELIMSDHFFNQVLTEESEFLTRFHHSSFVNTPSFDFVAHMSPAMYSIIHEMRNAPYTGSLKGVYLEAKAIELFLLQVQQLDRPLLTGQTKLKPHDIDCLHEIRNYITTHYDQSFSIIELARRAGINQMKLKNGFKELFGTTVFGHLGDVRMHEAKRLLVQEKMYVNEVADRIGYQHPHHFTAAFQKKFGILPKDLKK